MELHLQVKAREDIKKIWIYSFQEHGEQQADKYYDELMLGMESIRDNPLIGVTCDYIRVGYRQHHINKHLVFYRVGNKKIHVIRVLHERMQLQEHL